MEGPSPQEMACYQALRRLVQNHSRTHQLGIWNVYLATTALLVALGKEWCGAGEDARALVTAITAALQRGLDQEPPQPPLFPATVAQAQTGEPARMQATMGLTAALATYLGEMGQAQGLRLDQACGLTVRLVDEVLLMFLTEQPRAEVDWLLTRNLVPALEQGLGVEGDA